MCCCETPGQERVKLTVAPTLTPKKRRYIACPVPWVSSKDLSTNHVCHLNSPQWILLVRATPVGSWDRARTSIDHGAPHCASATSMARQGRKASPSVGTHPLREKDKAKKEALASPSLVSHMHLLLKNAIYLDTIGLL